jgi:long-chain fatty acid transport protein
MIGGSEKRAGRAGLLLLAMFAGLVVAAPAAHAQCGGLCLYEIGSTDSGSSAAGAGARAQDASTVFWNPAGMTRLEDTHILVGTDFGYFDSEFNLGGGTSPAEAGTEDGGSLDSIAPLAGFFVATTLYDELRFGMSLNALYAGSADYDNDWAGRSLVTEVAIVAFNIQPALAYPITDWLSIGAGANIFYVDFDQQFRANLAADAPTVEIQGADDWAFGANVAALLEPREGTRIGIYYRTKAEAKLQGDVDIPLSLSPNIDLELTFPQGVNVSLYHQVTPALALLGDAGWSDWSKFGSIPVSVGPIATAQERDWKDTWRVAGGLRYRAGERWLVQGGFSYDSSPVGASKRLPDIPASEAYRFSVGAEFAVADNIVLAPSYTLVWFGDAEVDSVTLPPTRTDAFPLGNPATVVLDGDYDPYFAHFVGFKLVIRFGGEQ